MVGFGCFLGFSSCFFAWVFVGRQNTVVFFFGLDSVFLFFLICLAVLEALEMVLERVF